ncbi:MAG: radical SAM protein [Armatimonadota bacterium]
MISISRLYCGKSAAGDKLRYEWRSAHASGDHKQTASERKPIVVWNSTNRCNLNCVHCYSSAGTTSDPNELTTEQAQKMIRQLAEFGVPVILFSGGEPLLREDIYKNAMLATSLGIRAVLSTNGTLITETVAEKLKTAGFSYVGISLDGLGEKNDLFRGKPGAFEAAKRAFQNCVEAGVKCGLRMTLTRHNYEQINDIFDFIEAQRISRACFYHLVYSGRASNLIKDDLSRQESRNAINLIIDRAADLHARGLDIEILTVDNHCDGAFLYMRMVRESHPFADQALQLLKANGGNSSGIGIAAIDSLGYVHADQFWSHYSFGNINERSFGEIWADTTDPIMHGLRNRKTMLKGRCRNCKWLDICNGNLRVRAEAVYGNVWAPDPACYLSDEEIGVTNG